MTEIHTPKTAVEQLQELRQTIADARPVPMSASCMVNRAEAMAAIDAVLEALPRELDEARAVIEASSDEVRRGRDEGDKIRLEAEQWAEQMASQSEITRRAHVQADQILSEARTEAEGLRTETDAYVETRMAEFEAELARTASQVRTMRARLAERLPKPDVAADDETHPLPQA